MRSGHFGAQVLAPGGKRVVKFPGFCGLLFGEIGFLAEVVAEVVKLEAAVLEEFQQLLIT